MSALRAVAEVSLEVLASIAKSPDALTLSGGWRRDDAGGPVSPGRSSTGMFAAMTQVDVSGRLGARALMFARAVVVMAGLVFGGGCRFLSARMDGNVVTTTQPRATTLTGTIGGGGHVWNDRGRLALNAIFAPRIAGPSDETVYLAFGYLAELEADYFLTRTTRVGKRVPGTSGFCKECSRGLGLTLRAAAGPVRGEGENGWMAEAGIGVGSWISGEGMDYDKHEGRFSYFSMGTIEVLGSSLQFEDRSDWSVLVRLQGTTMFDAYIYGKGSL